METRQANKIETRDVKTGQSDEMKTDNALYETYANMSDAEIAKLRAKRQERKSFSGKVLHTLVPEEFKKKNLHYEWIIYDPIVIDQKLRNGWVVVSDEKLAKLKGCSTTSQIKIPSGLKNDRGEPEYLILMAIHKKLYEDDILSQKQKMKEFNDNIDSGKSIVDDTGKQVAEKLEVKEVEVE